MGDTKEKEIETKTRTGGWPEVRGVGGDTDEESKEEASSSEVKKED